MNKITIEDYVNRHGQETTAKELGITQGAVSRALKQHRKIFLNFTKNGIEAIEIKPFPSNSNKQKSN
ncbi:MAG TPA: Cro/CI family transcriptional regulator [Arsenophonus apicola]|uniref:Cro/CI family transcriptional regulator n=1 Tax=Arsenophonus apicola TaxID=2879119 RepID=UPI001CDB67F0|nr:Cro/CI family transcriptional regulator [Arsenophonus apicola]UBX28496.1 Cro/CI family transcriptional regulator [Arsenophonus apicola]